MQQNKVGKIVSSIIIITAIGLALYVYTNTVGKPETDNAPVTTVTPSALVGTTIATNNVNNSPMVTKTPTATVAPTASAVQRSLLFFIDKNENGSKDSGEGICQACSGRSVAFAKSPQGEGLKMINIPNTAKITESSVLGFNRVFGVIHDRDVMVPPLEFGFGDGPDDIQVPVYEITGVVSAVNANVTGASDEDGTINYKFSKLIPTMKTAFDANKGMWVKFTPDTNNQNNYYLTKSQIEAVDDGYIARADWGNAAGSANVLKLDNIEFIIK